MIAVSLLVALAFLQAPGVERTGHISGLVTVEGNNAPVADARVTIILVAPSGLIRSPRQTTTGPDGVFQFDDVEPGGYRVSVQKMGFAPETQLPGQAADQLVQVGAGQFIGGVDRRLRKGAVISGRIFDADGEPIPDVQIIAMLRVVYGRGAAARLVPAAGRSQQTNDLGEFRVSGLPPGEYVIAAMPAPMHSSGSRTLGGPRMTLAQTYYPGTTDEATAAPVKVTASAEVFNISFAVQSAAVFRVAGSVVDEEGNAVANAGVMVNNNGPGFFFPGRSARTGVDGRFVVDDVPAGSYSVQATPIPSPDRSVGSGTSSSTRSGSGVPAPPSIVVTDADVAGLLVVTRRQ